MTFLLSQGSEVVAAGSALGSLPAQAILGVVCLALCAWVWRLDGKLDKAISANDAIQEARLADLKAIYASMGGKEH